MILYESYIKTQALVTNLAIIRAELETIHRETLYHEIPYTLEIEAAQKNLYLAYNYLIQYVSTLQSNLGTNKTESYIIENISIITYKIKPSTDDKISNKDYYKLIKNVKEVIKESINIVTDMIEQNRLYETGTIISIHESRINLINASFWLAGVP